MPAASAPHGVSPLTTRYRQIGYGCFGDDPGHSSPLTLLELPVNLGSSCIPHSRSTLARCLRRLTGISTVSHFVRFRILTSRASTRAAFRPKHFLQHRYDCDAILGSDLLRRPGHRLIQFDCDDLRFFALENIANQFIDVFSMSKNTDLACHHRPLIDRRLLLKEPYCLVHLRRLLAIRHLGREPEFTIRPSLPNWPW